MQDSIKPVEKDFKIKKGNWTTTFNDIFTAQIDGQKLKPETWGLYIFMLSLPDDWDFTIRGLAEVVNAGKDKIQRMLKELETTGFIKRSQVIENGIFGKIEYLILDKPESPYPENKDTENRDLFFLSPCPEKPCPENNDTKQNTNKQIYIDKLMIKGTSFPDSFHFLTRELLDKKVIDTFDYDLQKYNDMFFDFDKNYKIDSVLKATRYVTTWYLKTKPKLGSKYRWFYESIENNLKKYNPNKVDEFNQWWEEFTKSVSTN